MNEAASHLKAMYPRLRIPVAILTGDADAIVDVEEQSRRLHGDISGSTLVVLPGLGHMIHYVACDPIGQAIDGLMKHLGRKSRLRGKSNGTAARPG